MEGEIAKGVTKEDVLQMRKLEKAQKVKQMYIERLEKETKDFKAYRQGVKNNENLINRLEKSCIQVRVVNLKACVPPVVFIT